MATLALFLPVSTTRPASAAFALRKGVFSGGGAVVAGGSYRLGITVGETGLQGQVNGATRTLGAGFWPGQFWFVSGVVEPAPTPPPAAFVNRLEAPRPNPFNGAVTLTFSVEKPAPVRLRLFDVAGRHVATLVEADLAAGRYEVPWNGGAANAPLVNGIYFCRLEIGGWSQSLKLIKVR